MPTTAPADHIVYYARIADRVKIGTTRRQLRGRLNHLHAEELLAVEPGGRDVEAQRPRQFAADCIIGEWFRPSDALRAHISALTEEHGVPAYRPYLDRRHAVTDEQRQRAAAILAVIDELRAGEARLVEELTALNETGIGWQAIGRLTGYSHATLHRWSKGRGVRVGQQAS
jgi:hypothetical protein